MPEVLLQGDHAKVARWRRKKSLERTMDKRPDMFERLELSDKSDLKLLEEIKKDRSRMKLTQPVGCRPAEEKDLGDIMLIVRQARISRMAASMAGSSKLTGSIPHSNAATTRPVTYSAQAR